MSKKIYTCKYDRTFKEIFMRKENQDLLIALLESILNVKIKEIKYLNLEKNVDNINIRRKHFDLHIKTEKQNIQIEVNYQTEDYLRPRNAAYLFDTYSHEVRKGEEYDESILFVQINFTYGLKNSKYYDERDENLNKIMFTNKNNKPYINNLVLYEFNMDYYSKLWYPKDEKEIDEYKYIVMMNLGLDKLKVLSKKDRMVEKYMTELERVNEDPDFREYMSAEEDNLKIENSIKTQARKEGEQLKQTEIAKNMLKENIDKEVISRVTGIPISEIEKL